MSSTTSSGMHHFTGDWKFLNEPRAPAKRYDTHNGLRAHSYVPALSRRSPTPEHFADADSSDSFSSTAYSIEAASSKAVAETGTKRAIGTNTPRLDPPTIVAQYGAPAQYAHCCPQDHYRPHPMSTTYITTQQAPLAVCRYAPDPLPPAKAEPAPAKKEKHKKMRSDLYTYVPAQDTKTSKDPKPHKSNMWTGRTKTEVAEDDMKLAMSEGVYDTCKVQPIGVGDHQYFWVVQPDGGSTLRTFKDIKELKGEWKRDPRYLDVWYFLCG